MLPGLANQAHPSSNDLPSSSSYDGPPVTIGNVQDDLQLDSVTAFVGWDPSGGNAQQEPTRNLEEADLYEFLEERPGRGDI